MKCYGTKLGVVGRRQGKLGWDGMAWYWYQMKLTRECPEAVIGG